MKQSTDTLSWKKYNEILLRSKQGPRQVTISEVKSVYYRIKNIKTQRIVTQFFSDRQMNCNNSIPIFVSVANSWGQLNRLLLRIIFMNVVHDKIMSTVIKNYFLKKNYIRRQYNIIKYVKFRNH